MIWNKFFIGEILDKETNDRSEKFGYRVFYFSCVISTIFLFYNNTLFHIDTSSILENKYFGIYIIAPLIRTPTTSL